LLHLILQSPHLLAEFSVVALNVKDRVLQAADLGRVLARVVTQGAVQLRAELLQPRLNVVILLRPARLHAFRQRSHIGAHRLKVAVHASQSIVNPSQLSLTH
jgi:hypothetical protein